MSPVYRIVGAAEWARAQASGSYTGGDADRRDGFLHLSAAGQVRETARVWLPGRDDLLLLAIDAERLGGALRWERSRGGELFPHLYGVLPLAAVVSVEPLTAEADA